jgi:hypothetical protein
MNSPSRPYFDSNGRPIMEQSVVVLADILGYKDRVREAHDKGNEQEQLEWLNERLCEVHREIDDPSRVKWKMKTFSDNVIVGYRYLGLGNGTFELPQACYNICHFQLELSVHGLFIRGGIGVGSIHIGDTLIFGHILNELSEAEKRAMNPRVILLDSAMNQVNTHSNIDADGRLTAILWEDAGVKFINYLYPLGVLDDSRRAEMLQNHKRGIESNLQKYRDNRSIYDKYEWAARYHNRFCQESRFYNDNVYLISI